MSAACPHCHGTGRLPDPLENEIETLRRVCIDLAIAVTPPDFVRQADAARLLGRSRGTIANWASGAQPLEVRKIGVRNFYSLADIARFRLNHFE